jgi:hypothetical protein
MSNFALGFNNRAIASLGTMSGGSWYSTAGLAFLLSRPVAQVARSINALAASTTFTFTFGADQSLQAFGLAGHNFGLTATVRIRVFNAGASLVYDSTALNVWGSAATANDLIGASATYCHLAPSVQVGRSVQIDIVDTGNAAGYVQAGRLFLGPAWQGVTNMGNGASVKFEDPSLFTTAISGAKFIDKRQKFRVATFDTKWMLEAEAMNFALMLQQVAGLTEEVLFLWDPADTTYKGKRDLLGHFRALNPVAQVFLTTYATVHDVEEYL